MVRNYVDDSMEGWCERERKRNYPADQTEMTKSLEFVCSGEAERVD